MKSTEYRITNLVQDKLTGELLICCGTSCDTNGENSNISFSVLDRSKFPLPDGWQAEPITLTVEWLDKYCFTWLRSKSGTQGVYSNGKVNVMLSNSGNVYTMKNKLIPYVHTFQNWYYYDRLTNEELDIND